MKKKRQSPGLCLSGDWAVAPGERGITMDSDIPSSSLDECPRCSYPLSGLPSRHRCPECGFPYDKTWLCLKRQRSASVRAWVLYLILLVLLWQGSTVVFHRLTTARDWLHLLLGILGFVCLIWLLVEKFASRGVTEYLLVNPEAIEWQLRGHSRRTIPRMAIVDVKLTEDASGVALVLRNPDQTWTIPMAFMPRKLSPMAFQAVVSQGLRLSKDNGGETGQRAS